jgi:hypothetical protein
MRDGRRVTPRGSHGRRSVEIFPELATLLQHEVLDYWAPEVVGLIPGYRDGWIHAIA